MEDISLAHAKEHLEELLERARRGEDVRIVVPDKGAIRLLPAEPEAPRDERDKPTGVIFGQWKHLPEIPPERLLAPLTEDELAWLSGEASPVD